MIIIYIKDNTHSGPIAEKQKERAREGGEAEEVGEAGEGGRGGGGGVEKVATLPHGIPRRSAVPHTGESVQVGSRKRKAPTLGWVYARRTG